MKGTDFLKNKEKLFTVSKGDFRFDFYRGKGKGGQHKNKKDTACRCTHIASKAVACSEDQRSQWQNKKLAFKRCCETKKFKDWVKIEAARAAGRLKDIDKKVDEEMKRVRVEFKDEKGRWVNED